MELRKNNQISARQLGERSHKITEALYRVTGLFSEKEPLKWQLRTNALEIFDFLSSLEDRDFFDTTPVLNSINKISRSLQFAFSSGAYFSSINFDILRREYLLLSDEIRQIQSPLKLESPQELLIVSNGHSPVGGDVHNTSNGHNGQDNGQINNAKEKEKETEFLNSGNSVSNSIGNSVSKPPASFPFPIGNSVSKNPALKERQKEILSLIKENNNWMNINEIAAFLPKYGRKSIQRDLLEMAEIGIIKKTGDKRWRKYIPS